MDWVIRAEAVDLTGNLLPDASLAFYVDGELFARTKRGHGFATLQLEDRSHAVEVRVSYDS